MNFTIDFVEIVYSEKRLKKGNSFKSIDEEREIHKDDLTFNSYGDAGYWFQLNPTVEVDGREYETNPKFHHMGSPSFVIRPHRISKPKKPFVTKDELKKVLISGNDEEYNMLVLDFDGYPRLIQKSSQGYAVRLEGYAPGNGYVGERSKLNHLEETYRTLLEAWRLHLSCSKSIYRDYLEGKDLVEELIKQIQQEINKYE